MLNIKIYYLLLALLAFDQSPTQSTMYEITNCNGEKRVALYIQQLSNVMWCLKGDVSFRKNIVLKYSKNSSVNIDSLELKAIQFRKILPKNYWSDGVGAVRLDTKPNEDGSIWFERIYVQEDGRDNMKIFAACRVVFEGTDPEMERISPKIQSITMTLDKKDLKKYNVSIKKLSIVNNFKPTIPQKRKKGDKDEKPPEVEKLEN